MFLKCFECLRYTSSRDGFRCWDYFRCFKWKIMHKSTLADGEFEEFLMGSSVALCRMKNFQINPQLYPLKFHKRRVKTLTLPYLRHIYLKCTVISVEIWNEQYIAVEMIHFNWDVQYQILFTVKHCVCVTFHSRWGLKSSICYRKMSKMCISWAFPFENMSR